MSDQTRKITIMTNLITTDVNAAFHTERLALIDSLKKGQADSVARAEAYNARIEQRIKDGQLVSIGGDRYQVVDPSSWDNGEVWTMRKVSEQAPALILPEHGLAELEDGDVALYTKRPAWHNLGKFHLEGLTDISQVLKESGTDFDVIQMESQYLWGGKLQTVPGSFVNVRSDTGQALGVVGRVYTPVQNYEAFEFLQNLADKHDIIWESAGMTARGRVFVSMQLPDTLKLDINGVSYEIVPYVTAFNSHDGQSPFLVTVSPWAVLCGNTERFNIRDALSRWTVRHTTSATKKLEEARRTLGLSLKYYEALAEDETKLAENEMVLGEVQDLLADLWPAKELAEDETETVRSKNMREKRETALEELWGKNSKLYGSTAFAAERSVTEYLDHVAPRRAVGDKLAAARATAVLEGMDDDKKAKAHEKLMLRVRA
jgi:phage/plasmid-like protein (TIGR03299 family)